MIERSKQDSMRSLSRAATAVAGLGIGGLVVAGLIGVIAIIAFIVLELVVATVLWLARRYF
ncbi:hypothetical protein NX79_00770 [Xanthomonas vasicola]|uniref:hypothetical protein n=1 Tax=Xanthomonas vasicola TaxID=56459 RepID=UPI0005313509|nr:hypothetical protein [Xanthomonas vasicola]KGR62634.1 hypothetical protein NX79_00770 [Xanthomonas vasicola]